MDKGKEARSTRAGMAAKFLAEARDNLRQHRHFQTLQPAEQDAKVLDLARHIALSRSPIGQRAAAVSEKVVEFLDSMEEFLREYPDSAKAVKAGKAALTKAGLPETTEFHYGDYKSNHYGGMPELLNSIYTVVDLLCPSLDPCDPPDLKRITPDTGDEPETTEGSEAA